MPLALSPYAHLLAIAILLPVVFLTYLDALKCTWVSDDVALGDQKHPPIAFYKGEMQQPLSWHNLFKWLRYHYGKAPNPNKNWQRDKQPSHGAHPRLHHRLNLILFSGCTVLLYSFLCRVFGYQIAFCATLLFIVHPLGGQTVTWVSGIGYVTGFLFTLLGLNVVYLVTDAGWMLTPLGTLGAFALYAFCQWMAGEAMFAMVGTTLILIWLGFYPFAIIAGLLSIHQCLNTFKEAITLRRKVFKDQKMEASTSFYPRKLIVVFKTIYYNVKLAFFPKHMGLYHTFGYHYELPYIEQEDRYWIAGVATIGLLLTGVFLGPPALSLGCLWFIAYGILFFNWITANQFVVDRYVWLPSFGACLIVATYAPLWLFWLIVGIALMRTWAHLPTYLDEFQFYFSNMLNFPTSEVAMGNLGVAYQGRGWVGSSIDSWFQGSQLNPEYDVCWYNLSSAFLSRGPVNPNYFPLVFNSMPQELCQHAFNKDPMRSHIHFARYFLQRALSARTCHFPQQWRNELIKLEYELMKPMGTLRKAKLVQPMILEKRK